MTMRFTEMIHRVGARGQSIAAVGLVTILLLSVVLPLSAEPAKRDVEVLLVIGAPGSADYEAKFAEQASFWKAACAKAQVPVSVVGKDEKDAETLKSMLKAASTQPAGQFWLVFIGHGTFDNREAKFNLRGPDVTAKELAVWCCRHETRDGGDPWRFRQCTFFDRPGRQGESACERHQECG